MAGLSKDNPLKNVFNKKVVLALAGRIQLMYPEFDTQKFVSDTILPFEKLGFIERSNHLRDTLHKYLPKEYPKAIAILVDSLEPELEATDVAAWESFPVMSLCSFVSRYGRDHFDLSMNALYEMTKRFSAEGDLRTFIEVDYERAMKLLRNWCADKNPHVRRLVSEGTRPRLPLAGRIPRFQKDPKPVIKLLDRLVGDESLYVRRSVANNINDIAKDNPEIAVETLKRWNSFNSKNVQWVVKHAARSLIKQGHPEVLEIFGVLENVKIEVPVFKLNKKYYQMNDALNFYFEIISLEKIQISLIVDYVLHYFKANGKHKEKVFKLRELKIKPDQKIQISKKHILKNTSGRTHYEGKHFIELQINGRRFQKTEFDLKT